MGRVKRYRSLRQFFQDTGITQDDLAARVGITQAAVSKIMHGDRKPRWGLAKQIAALTGVPIERIYEPQQEAETPLAGPEGNQTGQL
jgi:gp16 family phage-associated protein